MKSDVLTIETMKQETPQVKISFFQKVKSGIEKWYLQTVKGIDPTYERIVRFYTYNIEDEGLDFNFACPRYSYDMRGGLYDAIVNGCIEMGRILREQYGSIPGKYYYDVKVQTRYCKGSRGKWEISYSSDILKTNNPRCRYGQPKKRKACKWLVDSNSKLMLEGYYLNGTYNNIPSLIQDLSRKVVLVHSYRDAKKYLRLVKLLGVNSVLCSSFIRTYNVPYKCAKFNDVTFGYRLERDSAACTMAVVPIPRDNLPASIDELMDIDEIITKSSWKARLRDLFC